RDAACCGERLEARALRPLAHDEECCVRQGKARECLDSYLNLLGGIQFSDGADPEQGGEVESERCTRLIPRTGRCRIDAVMDNAKRAAAKGHGSCVPMDSLRDADGHVGKEDCRGVDEPDKPLLPEGPQFAECPAMRCEDDAP